MASDQGKTSVPADEEGMLGCITLEIPEAASPKPQKKRLCTRAEARPLVAAYRVPQAPADYRIPALTLEHGLEVSSTKPKNTARLREAGRFYAALSLVAEDNDPTFEDIDYSGTKLQITRRGRSPSYEKGSGLTAK